MTETFEEHARKKKLKAIIWLVFVLVFILLSTITTQIFAPAMILAEAKANIDKNFADYRIVENSSEIDEKARFSKEKLYFAGDGLAVAPFLVRMKTMENHKAAFIETNHYYFWFFGYHSRITMSSVENITKDQFPIPAPKP